MVGRKKGGEEIWLFPGQDGAAIKLLTQIHPPACGLPREWKGFEWTWTGGKVRTRAVHSVTHQTRINNLFTQKFLYSRLLGAGICVRPGWERTVQDPHGLRILSGSGSGELWLVPNGNHFIVAGNNRDIVDSWRKLVYEQLSPGDFLFGSKKKLFCWQQPGRKYTWP